MRLCGRVLDPRQMIQTVPFFTMIVAETTYASNVEQVVILPRWFSKKFEVAQDVVGLNGVVLTGAGMIYNVNTDVFKQLNLLKVRVRSCFYISVQLT